MLVAVGALSRGFRLPDAGLQIYAEADVFEEERRAPERRRSATKAFLSDLRDLKVGDFVVHIDNGISLVTLAQVSLPFVKDAEEATSSVARQAQRWVQRETVEMFGPSTQRGAVNVLVVRQKLIEQEGMGLPGMPLEMWDAVLSHMRK